ncbi:coiled-coil domain-containing protein 187 isoform X2 [Periophthalmus magnuspinnatus]|uniref:coiled-coil domain-containing protein 187 isoform X2 n=1 Tax=Periophthalmus magnuspinnatus TaxID=409849 RepID=UPI0024366BFD|nr:coiled-coil domain-containing protein 187 isoform X2 [Periophthalmus magnuspinnatus]
MAELEVDQSHLPRVEEVRQNFAVLEDGVLAHSLQEQEIEQFYTTNVQKNQLVQNDIRVAKRLQDEEEEQRAQYSALLRQTSRQMEERDFEYARVIQEEIRRRAEEARRREMDDEELAKQIQEEEEERLRRSREAGSSDSEEQYSPLSSRGRRSTSDRSSAQCHSPRAGSRRGQRTNAGHSFRNLRDEGLLNEESDESDESDSVFSELHVGSRTVPPQRKPRDRDYRRVITHTSVSEHDNDHETERHNENGHAERRRERSRFMERDYRESRNRDIQTELAEVRERRCKRTESARLPDRRTESFRDSAKTWAYKDNPDKHVRFRDESRKSEKGENGSREVWEMLGQVLRERGVPVRMGSNGAPLQIGAAQRRERRGSGGLYGSEASCGDVQTHHGRFQRAAAARHSFHGDVRERRRRSFGGEQTQGRRRDPVPPETDSGQRRRESGSNGDGRGGRRGKERKKYETSDERNANEHGIERTKSERRPEREERERRAPNRSQSLRSRRTPLAERDRTSLELGELQQVLHDEELARKLQEEEEKVQSREIARYMQKQEITWKRRSRELDGPASWREHRAMMSQHDRRARDRQVPRERLDSEGLPSPTEEPPHSPESPLQTASQIRNIAEELDPTFPGRSSENLRGEQTGSCCSPLPQSGFQDEPTFIPPTKRQAEKSVRPKSKEKRENCKQQ